MSDEQLLFVMMGMFYALECVSLLRKPACCVVPGWRASQLMEPSSLFTSGDRGVIVQGCLPYQQSFISQHHQWMLDERGILFSDETGVNSDSGTSNRTLRFVGIEEFTGCTRSGAAVICGEDIHVHCGTEESAQSLCERLRQIRDAIPQDRAQLIEQQMRAAFDVSALDQEYRRFRKWTLPLQWACSLWAMWTLTTILLLNFWPAQRYSGNVLLIGSSGFLVLWFFTTATLIRANRQLRILQGREWNHALCRLLLVPMAAMRSPNWLSRHVLKDFDPLVIAASFCSNKVSFRLA